MAWAGKPSPWRGRVEAALTAFALHAAQQDRTLLTVLEALGSEADEEEAEEE